MVKRKQIEPPRSTRQPPEKKIGPFAGGIGVAIWINTIDSESGPRQFRSITIAPRRYLDRETGQWKDSGSFNPSDLPALIFALQKAQEYVFTTPLHEHETEGENGSNEAEPF